MDVSSQGIEGMDKDTSIKAVLLQREVSDLNLAAFKIKYGGYNGHR